MLGSDLLVAGGHGLVALLMAMSGLWLVSVVYRDTSLVDRIWGLSFVLQWGVYSYFVPAWSGRWWLLGLLVLVWGARLSWHIHQRNRGHGEDRRYQRLRTLCGPTFWWSSLFIVFWLQGLLSLVVGLPLLVVALAPPLPLGGLDLLGVCLWALGFYWESVGDWQLQRFKLAAGNHEKVLQTGLWRLSRHPNYFGDAVQWWGFYTIAAAVPHGWWLALPGPVLMTTLLLRVSGVTLLERDLHLRRPAYREYVVNTPAFFPDLRKLWRP